jgi:hypothetical protein
MRRIPFLIAAGAAGLLCLNQDRAALAYSLEDHEQLTRAAFRAIRPCLSSVGKEEGAVPASEEDQVVKANLWEDRNLLNKWLRYSHFYHPEHDGLEVEGIRENSKARILDLEDRMQEAVRDSAPIEHRLRLLGFMLHHVQDMTVPLHVLPVNHFWTDGFESFETPVNEILAFDGCEALLGEAARLSAVDLHEEVARATLKDTLEGTLQASLPAGLSIPLTWFWTEGSNRRFGSYGVLGNSFGMSWIRSDQQNFVIRQQEFARYKAARLGAAQAASQLLLMKQWLLGALDAAR